MNHHERKYTIGRAPSCDIVLADKTVSRVHAELAFLENGKLLVTDCRSTHGTVLMHQDGEAHAIRQELVSPLDILRFGSVSMPVKELLQAIHLKYPPAVNGGSDLKKDVPVASGLPVGDGLVRCECGAVKIKNDRCEVCDK